MKQSLVFPNVFISSKQRLLVFIHCVVAPVWGTLVLRLTSLCLQQTRPGLHLTSLGTSLVSPPLPLP